MKKLLVLIICLLLAAGAAACSQPDAEEPGPEQPGEEEMEWEATPTDLEVDLSQYEGYDQPAENEELVEDMARISELLGVSVALPEEFEVSRALVIDENIAQVEFTIGEDAYMGRYAAGLQENMSGMSKNFAKDETAEIAGLSVRLRYTPAEQAVNQTISTIGVADAYDAAKNISFMVVQMKNSSKEALIAAMEAFINSVE